MPWILHCRDNGHETTAGNLPELLDHHRDNDGWFSCGECGEIAFMERTYRLAEGEEYSIEIWGALRLSDDPESTYQPYVFIYTEQGDDPSLRVWFRYYKDLRPTGLLLSNLGKGPMIGARKVIELGEILARRPEANC